MSLFQKSVEKKYLNDLDSALIDKKYADFLNHFGNPEIQENIRNSKEEQYQGEFLIDLFVNILGYTKNPTPNFNLTTELKNITNSKKADGAIFKQGVATPCFKLSLSEEAEWMNYFNEQKEKAQTLKSRNRKNRQRNRPDGL